MPPVFIFISYYILLLFIFVLLAQVIDQQFYSLNLLGIVLEMAIAETIKVDSNVLS